MQSTSSLHRQPASAPPKRFHSRVQVVVPADDLSRQALSAQAEDLAVEDTLVVLDKALGAGALEADAYLRQVGGCVGGARWWCWARRGGGRGRWRRTPACETR